MLLVWLLHVLALVAFLVIRRHAKPEELRPQWDVLLTPRGWQTVDAVAREVRLDAKLLNDAFLRALKSRLERNDGEAIRFLRLACRVVEWTTPRKLDRLRAMQDISRMASALLPGPPVPARDFQMNSLVFLSGLVGWLHYVVATGSQRFRLRLVVIAAGFKMALSAMKRSVNNVEEDPAAVAKVWDYFSAAAHDFTTLDQRHLEAVRMLLEGRVAHARSIAFANALRTQ